MHFPNEILVTSPCNGFVINCQCRTLVVSACQRAKLTRAESFVTVEMVELEDISLMGFGLVFRLVISEVVHVSCLISEVVHVSCPVLPVGFV